MEGWQESQLYQVSKFHGCPGGQVPWEILQSWNRISVGLIRYSLKKRVSVHSVDNGSCFYCEICNSRNKLNLYIMKTATWEVEMIFVFKFAPNYRYTVC